MKIGNKELGRQVKQFRISRDMTQEQAAVLFGLNIATYRRVEYGEGCNERTRFKVEKVLTQQTVAA